MDNYVIKRDRLVGFKRGTTWGTAVEPTTGDQIKVQELSFGDTTPEFVSDADDYGVPIQTLRCFTGFPDEKTGSFSGKLRCEAAKELEVMAGIFGQYGSTIPEAGAVAHTFLWDGILADDIFYTIAADFGDEARGQASVKFKTLTLNVDGVLRWASDFGGTPFDDFTGFSNPLGITLQDNGECCFNMSSMKVLMNDFSAGAPTDPTDLLPDITNIEAMYERNYAIAEMTAGTDAIVGLDESEAPTLNFMLNFRKRNLVNKDYINDIITGDEFKAIVEFTGPQITGTAATNYSVKLYFPRLKVMEESHEEADQLPHTVTFDIFEADTAPTGFLYTRPYIEITNSISALTGYPSL